MYVTCNKYCHVRNVADTCCACTWLELSSKPLTSSCGLSPFTDTLSLAVQGNSGICSAPLQPSSFIVLLSYVFIENNFFYTYMNIVNVFINIIYNIWPKTICLHSVWPRQDKRLDTQGLNLFWWVFPLLGTSNDSSLCYNCELVSAPTTVLSPHKYAYLFRLHLQNSLNNEIWGCLYVQCCSGPALLRLLDGHTALGLIFVLSCPFFSGRLFCTRGWIGVWVFEYCYLLFFKGLLALPWGYCSRNSYLCYSPAYRLLTGTKWKNPTHSVLCFVNMFYCPWFSATYYSVSIFFFPPSICAYIAWQIMLFYITFLFIFPINCQYVSFQFNKSLLN